MASANSRRISLLGFTSGNSYPFGLTEIPRRPDRQRLAEHCSVTILDNDSSELVDS